MFKKLFTPILIAVNLCLLTLNLSVFVSLDSGDGRKVESLFSGNFEFQSEGDQQMFEEGLASVQARPSDSYTYEHFDSFSIIHTDDGYPPIGFWYSDGFTKWFLCRLQPLSKYDSEYSNKWGELWDEEK